MKTTNNFLMLMLVVSALASSLTFSGCKESEGDPCTEVTCMNGGEKYKVNDEECYCQCPAGYEGDHCEIELANCTGVECPAGKEPNPAKDCLCE